MVLGYGAIYNHSSYENVWYEYNAERSAMVYSASSPIKKGDELFISYGKDWFASRKAKEKKPSLRYRIRRFSRSQRVLFRGLTVVGLVLLTTLLSHAYLGIGG